MCTKKPEDKSESYLACAGVTVPPVTDPWSPWLHWSGDSVLCVLSVLIIGERAAESNMDLSSATTTGTNVHEKIHKAVGKCPSWFIKVQSDFKIVHMYYRILLLSSSSEYLVYKMI